MNISILSLNNNLSPGHLRAKEKQILWFVYLREYILWWIFFKYILSYVAQIILNWVSLCTPVFAGTDNSKAILQKNSTSRSIWQRTLCPTWQLPGSTEDNFLCMALMSKSWQAPWMHNWEMKSTFLLSALHTVRISDDIELTFASQYHFIQWYSNIFFTCHHYKWCCI